MKKPLLVLILGVGLMTNVSIAMADVAKTIAAPDKASTLITVSKVLQSLEAKGYVGLRELELDDNVYKADVVTAEGRPLDVKVNAMTGEVMGPKDMPNHLSTIDVAKRVEEAGYRITKIKAEGETYKVRALDKDGKKAALKVNARSGEISKKWFD